MNFLFSKLALRKEFLFFSYMALLILYVLLVWAYAVICDTAFFYVSYFVAIMLIFFLGYYLNQPLSVVSTKLLINLCCSVFASFNLYAYLFRVNLSKVWFFDIGITFLGFQCPLPQSVLILCAHSDLVLLSQQKP